MRLAGRAAMASIGHIAVGLAAGRFDREEPFWQRALLWSAVSLAPDGDVIGFAFGVPYDHALGHRGATHSLVVAAATGLVVYALSRVRKKRDARTAVLAAMVLASHGLLDALTDGGLGSALLWPFTSERFFFPWQPLPVSPLGRGLFSTRFLMVLALETLYFSPVLVYALWPRPTRDRVNPGP
jgi:inner membrane protein